MGLREWWAAQHAPEQTRRAPVTQFSKYDLLVPWWARYNEGLFVREAYRVNPLVRECIEYRCRSITAATMYAMREVEDGKEKLSKGHWMQKLLRRPSNLYPDQTSWMQQIERQLQITGECFVFLSRSGRGRVGETQILPGSCIQVVPGKTGVKRYDYRPNGQNEPIKIRPEEMIFFRYDDPYDPLRGVSPLAAAWREIQTDNSMTDYRKAFFDHAAIPSLILTTTQPANTEQLRQWSEDFTDKFGGPPEAGKVATLGGGLSAERIGATPQEIDFGNVGALPEIRICQAFGLDPILISTMIGVQGSTYSNKREAKFGFWEDSVIPEMERLQDRITVALTTIDDDNFVEFDVTNVPGLQGYREKEGAIQKEGLINGAITVNEYRKAMGLNPVEDGNVYYRPGSLTPVPEGKLDEEPPDPLTMLQATTDAEINKGTALEKAKADNRPPSEQNGGRPANKEKDQKKAPRPGSANDRSSPAQDPDARLAEILGELHAADHQLITRDRALYVAKVAGATRSRLRRMVRQVNPELADEDIADWLDFHTIELGNDAADLGVPARINGFYELAAEYTTRASQAFMRTEGDNPGGLSDTEWAELDLEAAAIKTEVMEQGESAYQFAAEWEQAAALAASFASAGTLAQLEVERKAKPGGKHGPSIKCPDIYEALRRKGKSKKNAAQISNECWKSPKCNCH
jgi:HK97 family phage portal protein